jgi:hypothetical protein
MLLSANPKRGNIPTLPSNRNGGGPKKLGTYPSDSATFRLPWRAICFGTDHAGVPRVERGGDFRLRTPLASHMLDPIPGVSHGVCSR